MASELEPILLAESNPQTNETVYALSMLPDLATLDAHTEYEVAILIDW